MVTGKAINDMVDIGTMPLASVQCSRQHFADNLDVLGVRASNRCLRLSGRMRRCCSFELLG